MKMNLTDNMNREIFPKTHIDRVLDLDVPNIDASSLKVMYHSEYMGLSEPDIATIYVLIEDVKRELVEYIVPYPMCDGLTGNYTHTDAVASVWYKGTIISFQIMGDTTRYYDCVNGGWAKIKFDVTHVPSGTYAPTTGNGMKQFAEMIIDSRNLYQLFRPYGSEYIYLQILELPDTMPPCHNIISTDNDILAITYGFRVQLQSYYKNPLSMTKSRTQNKMYMLLLDYRYSDSNDNPPYYIWEADLSDYSKISSSVKQISGPHEFNLIVGDHVVSGNDTDPITVKMIAIDSLGILRIAATLDGSTFYTIDHSMMNGELLTSMDYINPNSVGEHPIDIKMEAKLSNTGDILAITRAQNNNDELTMTDVYGSFKNRSKLIKFNMATCTFDEQLTIRYSEKTWSSAALTMSDSGEIYRIGATMGREITAIKYAQSTTNAWTIPRTISNMDSTFSICYYSIIFVHNRGLYMMPHRGDSYRPRGIYMNLGDVTDSNGGSLMTKLEYGYDFYDTAGEYDFEAVESNGSIYLQTTDAYTRTFKLYQILDYNDISGNMVIDVVRDRVAKTACGMVTSPVYDPISMDSYFSSVFLGDHRIGTLDTDGLYKYNSGNFELIIPNNEVGVMISPIAFKSNGDMVYQIVHFDVEDSCRIHSTELRLYSVSGEDSIIRSNLPMPDWIIDDTNGTTMYDHFTSIQPIGYSHDGPIHGNTKCYIYMDRYIFRSPSQFGGDLKDMAISPRSSDVKHNYDMQLFGRTRPTHYLMYAYDMVDHKWIKLQEPPFEQCTMYTICIRESETIFKFISGIGITEAYPHITSKIYDISKDINIINGKSMT